MQPDTITYPELLAATGGGIISGPDTAAALADAWEPLLLDPARLRSLGDAGRTAVHARYNDDAMALGIARATEALLSRKST